VKRITATRQRANWGQVDRLLVSDMRFPIAHRVSDPDDESDASAIQKENDVQGHVSLKVELLSLSTRN